MRFDLLRANDGRLYMVDCIITPLMIGAGWVYFAKGLGTQVELFSENGDRFTIEIPEILRRTPSWGVSYYPDQPVDFVRINE